MYETLRPSPVQAMENVSIREVVSGADHVVATVGPQQSPKRTKCQTLHISLKRKVVLGPSAGVVAPRVPL